MQTLSKIVCYAIIASLFFFFVQSVCEVHAIQAFPDIAISSTCCSDTTGT